MSYVVIGARLPGIGSKRVCVSCAARFYDLARTPPVCPKCGTEQPPEAPRAPPIKRGPSMRHRMVKPAPAAEADEDAAPVLDPDDDEEEADEDADAAVEEIDEAPEAEPELDEAG